MFMFELLLAADEVTAMKPCGATVEVCWCESGEGVEGEGVRGGWTTMFCTYVVGWVLLDEVIDEGRLTVCFWMTALKAIS